MATSNCLTFGPELSLAFGAIGAAYAPIGTFLYPARNFTWQNLTDQTLVFSMDGVNDAMTVVTMVAFTFDATTNSIKTSNGDIFPQGTVIWVKYQAVAPASGSANVSYISARSF